MSRPEHSPEVLTLAGQLGLGGAADAVDAILHHCRTRIDRWDSSNSDVRSVI